MKLFECADNDWGGKLYVVADNIHHAIELFEKEKGYLPQMVFQTAEENSVIVQDIRSKENERS